MDEEVKIKRRGGAPKGVRYGGRKKGTPNKVSGALRERIAKFLDDKWDEAEAAWDNIDEPKDKLKLYIELSAYVMPKLQSVQLQADVHTTNSVQEDLIKLATEE